MKRAKLIICCLFFCTIYLFSIEINAQNYYWSGGVKVNLHKDTLSFVLYGEDPNVEILKSIGGLEINQYKAKDEGQYTIFKGIGGLKTIDEISDEKKSFALIRNLGDTVYLSNFLVLKLNSSNLRSQLNQILQKYNGIIISEKYQVLKVKISNIGNVISCANEIYESGIAKWCHPDFLVTYRQCSIDNWTKQYYLWNRSHGKCTFYNDIGAYDAWKITKGCSNIRVAVIDIGGVGDHPALKDENNNSRVLSGYTPSDETQNGRPLIGTNDRHGQACAGIIAASHNSEIRGIAPNVKIVPVRISSTAPASDFALAISWAWDPLGGNADILSNSWREKATPDDVVIQAIRDAQTEGRNKKGAIVVFGSGNEGESSVSGYSRWAISVGAINQYNEPAKKTDLGITSRYTNIGADLDLVAYGGDHYYIPFSSRAHGDIRTLDISGNDGYVDGDYYDEFTGTSAACPQVSGVAALVLSVNPNLTRQEVENILFSTATDLGTPGRDDTYGHGKIDAFKAVQAAINSLGFCVFAPKEFYLFAPVKKDENIKIIFSRNPKCNVAAGTYWCDIYESSFTIYTNNTDWIWFLGDGLSYSNPNSGAYSYSINNDTENNSITVKTYYYYIKTNILGQNLNQRVPENPGDQKNRRIWINASDDIIYRQSISSGQSLDIAATNSISLLDGFNVEENGLFSASIAAYSDKINCGHPIANPAMINTSGIQLEFENMNETVNSSPILEIITEKIAEGIDIILFTENNLNIEQKANVVIYMKESNIIVSQKEVELNTLTLFPITNQGIYKIKVIYDGNEIFKEIEI